MIGRRGPVAQMEPQEGGRYVGGASPLLMVDAARVYLTRVQRLCRFLRLPLGGEEETIETGKRSKIEGGEDESLGSGGGPRPRCPPSISSRVFAPAPI